MPQMSACWCGNEKLEDYSSEYNFCRDCGTLVLKEWPEGDPTRVSDHGEIYSDQYYLKHLPQDYGYPSLEERARNDLTERVLFWAKTFLRHKLPPARVLELGCAHGGFVAILRLAGYEAAGLELSPWLVNYARRTFDIPVYQGPLEDQVIAPSSIDAIVLMDVLEHLPDPLGTMRRALDLLRPDGILLIQTPNFLEDKSYAELKETKDPFLNVFKKDEHLYLYSSRAVQSLLSRLNCQSVIFEPAIFSQYDMFFIAGRQGVSPYSQKEIEDALQKTPATRLVLALLDLYTKYQASEVDRLDRWNQIQALTGWLHEARAEREQARKNILYRLLGELFHWP